MNGTLHLNRTGKPLARKAERPMAAKPETPPGKPRAREIAVGTMEGVRVIRQHQPVVTWKNGTPPESPASE